VKNGYRTELEAWTLNGLEEPLKKSYDMATANTVEIMIMN
jgi:hypothetical protein